MDRAAAWSVTAGGLAIIASILGIFLFILAEVLPLALGARVTPGAGLDLPGSSPIALVSDEYRTHAALLTERGSLEVYDLETGQRTVDRPLVEGGDARLRGANATDPRLLVAATDEGELLAVPLDWEVSFVGIERQVRPRSGETMRFDVDPERRRVGAFAVRVSDEGPATAAAQLADGALALLRLEVEENPITEERIESWSRYRLDDTPPLTALVMDEDQRNLYGGTASGELLWWGLTEDGPGEPKIERIGSAAVTALGLLIGNRSLVVGREDGSIEIWFAVREPEGGLRLRRIREFPPHPGPIRLIAPSLRDKGFLALDDGGEIGLFYSTSHRVLWTGRSPLDGATAMFYAPKTNGAYLAAPGRLASFEISNPHPEIGFRALFGKVWYEGYPEPEYVWQSTGGTDDFEPKLSLTPLMIGTLKGTAYSLLLAIPLAVLGALYASHFMHPSLKHYVKPTVEIMAALPSVVLGFLAGLWLAPRVERILPALVVMTILLPLVVVATGYLWRSLPRSWRGRLPVGAEFLLYMVVLLLAMGFCFKLNHGLEAVFFGGDFQAWLLETSGLRYDQRNAIVVGLAMGFAVIPIIFSIAEDAFSNVPQSLVSGSLALGASRWQTAARVVVPAASPGIFSAIMIGFGRAVGETMIVLMATGNTPILDWNPFNGFRTLSANIAVEIPEAPHSGTLYRTLFLAAIVLFVFTFAINTGAELVRQRLRQRYSEK